MVGGYMPGEEVETPPPTSPLASPPPPSATADGSTQTDADLAEVDVMHQFLIYAIRNCALS